jgi:hypothetical protein
VEQEIQKYKNKLIKQGGTGCLGFLVGISLALILVMIITIGLLN